MALGAGPLVSLEAATRVASTTVSAAALEGLLLSDPVAAMLARQAIRVESAAKVYATGNDGGPNVRTGRLRGSITWTLDHDAEGLHARIGSNVEYAIFVEMGTSRMHERPYLRPALNAVADGRIF